MARLALMRRHLPPGDALVSTGGGVDLLAQHGEFVAGGLDPALAEPVQAASRAAFTGGIDLLLLAEQPSGLHQLGQAGYSFPLGKPVACIRS